MSKELRDFFDINPDVIQLNSGTLSILPRVVKQSIRTQRDEFERNPAQGLFGTWEKLWESQRDLASLLKVNPSDLVLRPNVTWAMSDFLMGVELPVDSEILTSDLEYGAIFNILKFRAQKDKLSLKTFHLPGNHQELQQCTVESILNTVKNSISNNTRLLMLSHVTTGSGLVLPIKEIAKFCQERNILFAVDGAHGPGALQFNIEELGCDFYGSNLHKWMLGPKGTGFGWYSHRIKNHVEITNPGWTTFETPKPFLKFAPNDRFQQKWMINSSLDFSNFFSITAMVKFWKSVGEENIHNELSNIGSELHSKMEKTGWKSLRAQTSLSGPLYAYELPTALSKMDFALMDHLNQKHKLQVAVTNIQGKWCLRLAPQIYNTSEEIDKAVEIFCNLEREI